MKIGNFEIGVGKTPFIIAEMSGNHGGSKARALEIIDAAAASGAHAIKFQTYTPDTLTLKSDKQQFRIEDPSIQWSGRTLYDLYEEAHTPWEWHADMFARAATHGLMAFSSPFDITAVDFLEQFNPPVYKIASFESIHLPLIKRVATTGKPMIISTGLATEEEIHEALDAARGAGAKDIILLKCTSDYPARKQDANLATIIDMQKKFSTLVGLSDHTRHSDGVSVEAVKYYGAVAIEKHLTLGDEKKSVDSNFSLTPAELTELMKTTAEAAKHAGKPEDNAESPAHGIVQYGGTEKEQVNRIFRVSVQVDADIEKGGVFTEKNLIIRRPGYGLAPKYLEQMLGKKSPVAIERGDITTLELLGHKRAV